MRISLVTDWFHPRVGGIEVHVHGLAVRLAQRGHEVRILTPWPGESEVDGVPVDRLPVSLTPGLGVALSPLALVRELRAAVEAHPCDILHGHASFASTTVMAAGHVGTGLGIPMLGTFHSVLRKLGWVYVLSQPVVRWRRWPFRATAVSEAVARDLRWIMPERDVEILPNAIDPQAWPHAPPEPEVGRLRLVTTSRLQRRKRVGALIRAVAEVRKSVGREVDVCLDVMGTGPEEDALASLVRRLGVEDSVRLLGPGGADDVRALLARGDVFVNAADQESFGIAALEALSTGLPVVARVEGGVGTFIRSGVNGVLVASDQEMVGTLVALASDPRRLAELREGAAEGIPGAYTWEALLDRHEALYGELLGASVAAE